MLNRRSKVFETNSSSVHTITIDSGNVNDLVVETDGYIHLSLPYYGRMFDSFNNSYDKLCYAILTVCYTRNIYLCGPSNNEEMSVNEYLEECQHFKDSVKDLMLLPEYREIEECVVTEINRQNRICRGIKIHMNDSGIDHQSQEYNSIYEFLEENNIENIHEFIFGNYTLNTGSD